MQVKLSSMKTLTKFVLLSIIVVLIYSIAEFISSIVFQVSHEVLTGCIYAFFGTEIAACGFIKIFKIKKEEVV